MAGWYWNVEKENEVPHHCRVVAGDGMLSYTCIGCAFSGLAEKVLLGMVHSREAEMVAAILSALKRVRQGKGGAQQSSRVATRVITPAYPRYRNVTLYLLPWLQPLYTTFPGLLIDLCLIVDSRWDLWCTL